MHLSGVAQSVTLSRKQPPNETDEMRAKYGSSLPPKTILKNVVKRFKHNGAEFVDGSEQNFSAIIYATGKVDSDDLDQRHSMNSFRLQILLSLPDCQLWYSCR